MALDDYKYLDPEAALAKLAELPASPSAEQRHAVAVIPAAVSSKATTDNPKDLMGRKKVALSSVPPIAIAHESCAMLDGAFKYGPYNWRQRKVRARIYADAAKRHIDAWLEGQEHADDSGVHHLGHARACLGILLDAQMTDSLIDDRPIFEDSSAAFNSAMERLNAWTAKRTSKG